ncbi:MAG: endonuclease [Ignavibacteriaceae bacterium]
MIKNLKTAINFLLLLLILFPVLLSAQGTYYNLINTSSPTFVDDLKSRIRIPYTKVSYDLFDETNIANFASYDKGGGVRGVKCVYSNYEYEYSGTFTWAVFSREHTFCFSWMPTNPSTSGNEYADQHHLFPTHQNSANGVRSNHPLDTVVTITSTFGEAKYGKNSLNQYVYEPRPLHKGDAARAILYMMLRYDDLGGNQWDFDWLNNTRLPALSEAPQNLTRLIQWHYQDPPDDWERARNDYIQSIQGNRNPFVDHPEYVDFINFNNMTYKSSSSPTNTIVQFNSSAGSVAENGGTYVLTLTIQNPSPTTACSVQVALTSGTASNIGNYTTQTVVFPANSSANQTVTLTITDNSIIDGDKLFTFTLQNISGGNTASIGSNSTFNLTVYENEISLFISEYADASGTGNFIYEFVEIFNDSYQENNLGGYHLHQIASIVDFTIPANTIIPPKGFLIIGRNSTQTAFETFWNQTMNPDNVVYVNSGEIIPLINGSEQYQLRDASSNNVDPLSAFSFIAITQNNRVYRTGFGNTSSDWVLTGYSSATPGALENDSPLPVELTSFTASVGKGTVTLNWSTATETNNFGFNVETFRSTSQEWKTIAFIPGSGNSNSVKEYSFTYIISPSSGVKYRLKQIDNDGYFSYSKEILLENHQPLEFELHQNYPNPFNPSTVITYQLPRNSEVKLKIFDILGNEIKTIVSETQLPGNYSVEFNGDNLPSGVYFYTIFTNEFTSTKRMSLIK